MINILKFSQNGFSGCDSNCFQRQKLFPGNKKSVVNSAFGFVPRRERSEVEITRGYKTKREFSVGREYQVSVEWPF